MARPVGTTIGEQLRDWRTRRHLSQLSGYPGVFADGPDESEGPGAIAVPLLFRFPPAQNGGDAPLSFISTITTFGTAIDVTLAELAIESFFPADEATTSALWRLSSEPLSA